MTIAYPSLAAVTLLATAALRAQAPMAVPKPGPEQQKLAYFAGRWNEAAEMKPGPMGPGGKMTGTSTCEWFAGGFSLVCRSEARGPSGEPHNSLGVLGYSTERKRYTYYGIDNTGMGGGDLSFGELTGDTWTWEGESLMGGKPIKGHYTIKQVSPDSYTWRWELAVGGGPLTLIAEGTDTRVK
jgi:hypothetical protein